MESIKVTEKVYEKIEEVINTGPWGTGNFDFIQQVVGAFNAPKDVQ